MKEINVLSAKAQMFIRSAEQVLGIGDYDSCASRCYYAMFLMAEAVLLTKELSASTHRGVISLFGEHFARTGVFDARMGTALNYAYKKRIVGDYGMGASVTQEEAGDLLNAAQEFVAKVQSYLDQWTAQEEKT